METSDLKALAAFGKLGLDLAASRILSYSALAGVVDSPTWQGAAVDGILALCFWVAVKAESRGAPKEE